MVYASLGEGVANCRVGRHFAGASRDGGQVQVARGGHSTVLCACYRANIWFK